jgi:hypothetical protein
VVKHSSLAKFNKGQVLRVDEKTFLAFQSMILSYLSSLFVKVDPCICVRLEVPVLQDAPKDGEGKAVGQDGLREKERRSMIVHLKKTRETLLSLL